MINLSRLTARLLNASQFHEIILLIRIGEKQKDIEKANSLDRKVN